MLTTGSLHMRRRFGAEITSVNSSNKLNHVWMTSRSTERLAESELGQAGNWSEVRPE